MIRPLLPSEVNGPCEGQVARSWVLRNATPRPFWLLVQRFLKIGCNYSQLIKFSFHCAPGNIPSSPRPGGCGQRAEMARINNAYHITRLIRHFGWVTGRGLYMRYYSCGRVNISTAVNFASSDFCVLIDFWMDATIYIFWLLGTACRYQWQCIWALIKVLIVQRLLFSDLTRAHSAQRPCRGPRNGQRLRRRTELLK
jgi:hypothetical protein